ncbi:hypothetical protein [Rhodococcus sp. OK519]|uniref:hypothetical protein n=1 Tax=Rhodococcus sp. OK519 TaxID=2135729 RepID=UPI0011B2077F
MSNDALRLLQLQKEFQDRETATSLAQMYSRTDWSPRSEEEIAVEYAATLRRLLSSAEAIDSGQL